MTIQIDRPILKYYGGKFRLADWIISFFPEHLVYTECFGGAASVLLKKKPSKHEVYNDLNDEVVNLFRVVRDPETARKLRHLLKLTPYSRVEWMSCFEPAEDPVEQARRTLVKSLMSLGVSSNRKPTGFRVYTKNYHYLPQRWNEYTEHIKLFTTRMKEVCIEHRDAIEVMREHDSIKTLHYVDPPYLSRSSMQHGYKIEMKTEHEHEALLIALKKLKGFVVLSGYAHDLYFDQLREWGQYSMKTVTGASTAGKSYAQEIVFLNPAAVAAKRQMELKLV
jgi:DNA adenine methylase